MQFCTKIHQYAMNKVNKINVDILPWLEANQNSEKKQESKNKNNKKKTEKINR